MPEGAKRRKCRNKGRYKCRNKLGVSYFDMQNK